MKTIKFLLIAIIFFAAGFFVSQSYQTPVVSKPTSDSQQQQLTGITQVLQFAENDIREIQNLTAVAGETVLDLLTRVVQENNFEFKTKDYGDLGILVTQIGDKVNGQDNRYWQYWVNGEQVMVGAGKYKLSGGERIEWKFVESEF